MLYETLPFIPPTWLRWVKINFSQNLGLLRALQYEALESQKISGDVLDFGGGEQVSYRGLLQTRTYTSVNIDPKIQPTFLVDVDGIIPNEGRRFETALSMNTFEHIYDSQKAIIEIHRCLKDGGRFMAAVPFLFPVHGHPDDFFRPTPSWWGEALTRAGFVDVRVQPLYWGPFSTGAVLSGLPGPGKKIRLALAMLMDVVYAKIKKDLQTQAMCRALGYFVFATKVPA